MKTISTSLLTLTLLAAAGPNHACSVARDDWMGRDKAAHFGASLALGVAGSRLTNEPWEAVGLALMISAGPHAFDELLHGAERMDEHFRSAPLSRSRSAKPSATSF